MGKQLLKKGMAGSLPQTKNKPVQDNEFWGKAIGLIPAVKTPIQLTAMLVVISGYLAYRSFPAEYTVGAIAGGTVGLMMLVFGMVLQLTGSNADLQKPGFLLSVLLILVISATVFFFLAIYFLPTNGNVAEYKAFIEMQHAENTTAIRKYANAKSINPLYTRKLGDLLTEFNTLYGNLVLAVDSGRFITMAGARKSYNDAVAKAIKEEEAL